MQPDQIILVYNTDNGLFNAVTDWSHKFFSPETYQCSLCRFTFGLTGMLMPWKTYLELLPISKLFFHRPDFRLQYPAQRALPLPVILAVKSGRIQVLLSAEDINSIEGLSGLIGLMQARLEQWRPAA